MGRSARVSLDETTDAGGSEMKWRRAGAQHGAAHGCDAIVGDGAATNDRAIQDTARDLAHHIHSDYTSRGRPVDVVAHSMGGLITRVALLGSAQGYRVSYWHAAGDHPAHETGRGWSPLKTAFQAATRDGDGLPR
jgi:surfactin synthase thioesterase subunit